MIQQVVDFVVQHYGAANGDDYAINVEIKQPLLVQIIFANKKFYFVKIAEKSDIFIGRLYKEYLTLSSVYKMYQALIPKPLNYHVDENTQRAFLIIEGIRHSAVELSDVLQANQELQTPLQSFLAGQNRTLAKNHSLVNTQFVFFEQAISGLSEDLCRKVKKIRYRRQWDAMLRNLPMIPQHGDLALNNIGLSETKDGFILFDWEDYDAVQFAGFDLCVLLVSGCKFDLQMLLSVVEQERKSKTESLIIKVISCIGVSESNFYDLILFHLILFHKLKSQHGYSITIINHTENLISNLISFIQNDGHLI